MNFVKSRSIRFIWMLVAVVYPMLLMASTGDDESWPGYGRIGLSYTYQANTTQQYNVCHLGLGLTDRLVVETPVLGFSRIVKDPYNKAGSYSFVPLAMPLILSVALADSSRLKSPWVKNTAIGLSVIHCMMNSTVYVSLTGNMREVRSSPKYKLIISPFVKNETDWFVTRRTDWLQFSPGAGLRVYIGQAAGLFFSTGYQRAFQTDFKGHWKAKGMLFFNVGFDVDFEAGMSV